MAQQKLIDTCCTSHCTLHVAHRTLHNAHIAQQSYPSANIDGFRKLYMSNECTTMYLQYALYLHNVVQEETSYLKLLYKTNSTPLTLSQLTIESYLECDIIFDIGCFHFCSGPSYNIVPIRMQVNFHKENVCISTINIYVVRYIRIYVMQVYVW